jgi:hypothetical protein
MTDYYEPILPDGHHLALSRKNDGAFSGNSFDDSGALGRPDWRRVDRGESDSRDDADAPALSMTVLKVAIGVAAGAVATIIAIKAAPHAKHWWNDFRSRWNGRSEAGEPGRQAATAETATLSIAASADFPSEVAAVLDEDSISMSSAEAQQRLLAILLAGAFIADQMRVLSNARVEDADAPLELTNALEKLSAPQLTDTINRMLQANTSLLDTETSAEFMRIFGGGRIIDGRYVPLRNGKVKGAFRLTDSETQPTPQAAARLRAAVGKHSRKLTGREADQGR